MCYTDSRHEMIKMAKRYKLSDSEWERIENLFPSSKTGPPPKWDNKTMLNAILLLARSGSAWEDIPIAIRPTECLQQIL